MKESKFYSESFWFSNFENHGIEKYDENYFSLDERLKHSVKRNYFSNINELDYNKIRVKVL